MALSKKENFWLKVAAVVVVVGALAYFLPEQYVIMKPKEV